jgi:hypothetical protein
VTQHRREDTKSGLINLVEGEAAVGVEGGEEFGDEPIFSLLMVFFTNNFGGETLLKIPRNNILIGSFLGSGS